MNLLERLRLDYQTLTVWRGAMDAPVPAAFRRLLDPASPSRADALACVSDVLCAAAAQGEAEAIARAVSQAVLYDDNPAVRMLAAGRELPAPLAAAARHDLAFFETLSRLQARDVLELAGATLPGGAFLPEWSCGRPDAPLQPGWAGCLPALADFYRTNGFGPFARYRAFRWENGVRPIAQTDPITLADLKGYEAARAQVLDNTEAFVRGLPANNMLLYGDRGTGKSATVHAMLNEFYGRGLRMLELSKEQTAAFAQISKTLSEIPLKFIVFIDDLSFSEHDDTFASLKAMLEGSLSPRPGNLLVYATSNRRHLVRERTSDREGDDVHRADTIQELLALSDRFGITVTFLNPNRDEYLRIVAGMAADRGLDVDPETLAAAAERFALSRAGRSPRTARQFIDRAEARLRRGLPLS